MAKTRAKAVPAPTAAVSISIRKITNGYVVTKSGQSRGKYFQKETFSATNPLAGMGKKR